MKTHLITFALIVAGILTACNPQSANPNAAVFQSAAKSVTSVREIAASGSTTLDDVIASLGGFPPAAEVSITKRLTNLEFAVGYNKDGRAIVAVSYSKDAGIKVETDPLIVSAYSAKLGGSTPEKAVASTASSSESSATATPDKSGPAAAPTTTKFDDSKTPKGSKVKVGMSKSQAKTALHGEVGIVQNSGTDHEIWNTKPISTERVEKEAITQVASGFGLFGGLAGGQATNRIKEKAYIITFSGDTVSKVSVSLE